MTLETDHAEVRFESDSADKTFRLGSRLGQLLLPGANIGLVGDLGSGKTLLTKGLACGLGVKNYRLVNSPTFVIKQEYVGRLRIHHYDAYRLAGPGELLALGFTEDLASGDVVVVEWADRIGAALPPTALKISLEHVPVSSTSDIDTSIPPVSRHRLITVSGVASSWRQVLESLKI